MSHQSYDRHLTTELKAKLAALLKQSPGLSPAAAMAQITRDMLVNNPFNPPSDGKCPINNLSDDLLAYIFKLGVKMMLEEKSFREDEEGEWESEDEDEDSEDEEVEEDDEDEEEDEDIPFQILISHICARWRNLALNTPSLWAILRFEKGTPLDRHKTFLERAKMSLLDIEISMEHDNSCDFGEEGFSEEESVPEDFDYEHQMQCQKQETELIECLNRSIDRSDSSLPTILDKTDWYTGSYVEELGDSPDDCCCCDCYYSLTEFSEILDLIIPRLQYWRVLDVVADDYRWMYLLLARLHQCGPANNLEILKLFHIAKSKVKTEPLFYPPRFATSFAPFGGNMPRLRQYVLWAVHVDWDACISALGNAERANLSYHSEEVRPSFQTFEKMVKSLKEHLILRLSGPKETEDRWRATGMTPILIPSLKALTLWHFLPEYATSLLRFLDTPGLVSLSLSLGLGEYGDFVKELCQGLHGRSKSLLVGLEHLNVRNLDCKDVMVTQMLDQLSNLKSLELDCDTDAGMFFDALLKPKDNGAVEEVYCPLLKSVDIAGKTGEEMKQLVKAREKAGVPLKQVYLSCGGEMDPALEGWLREHLEEFEMDCPAFVEEE